MARPDSWILKRRIVVGARMRSLREAAELSQEDLGERTGLDRKSINRYETGARSMTIDRAFQIALALDVPITWLFTDSWSTDDDAPLPPCN